MEIRDLKFYLRCHAGHGDADAGMWLREVERIEKQLADTQAKLEAAERKIEQFRERTNRCQTCAKTDEECERRTTGLEPLAFVSTCAMRQAKALTQEDKGDA
jgi:prefoldin subunit 5